MDRKIILISNSVYILTALTYDTETIESLILNGQYESAAEKIFELVEKYPSDKELIYKSLSLLNLICDKTPSISLRTVKTIPIFINDYNSWNRLVSLEILYQISLYRPNLLIHLIDKIRKRLFDKDASVRRLTVKLIGNLILSLHIDKEDLYNLIEEFTEKLMDNDWKVKLLVIKTLQKILNQDYTKIKDLEPLLSIVIVNLRDADDDVARAAAELLKILGIYFLSKEKIFYVLLNLLYNEKPRVKELIIWLFGEIGKEKSSEIIPIIPKIIKLLNDKDYRIQLKVIDALVKISENNFDQIFFNLINSLDTSNKEFKNNIINGLYHLAQKNINIIFDYLFEEFENPSENIRQGIALVLKRLFEEYQMEIENEIAKILYQLESKFWRERRKTILLIENICFILNSQKIAVWITIELKNALKKETDPDVKKELMATLDNINSNFKDINKTIERIKNELNLFHSKILEFQKAPALFRKKLNSYINEFKFNQTEIQLNKIYNKILKDIKKFDNNVNNFEYKRLAFDLIEEWEETKVQIIDELSIIKGFIYEICEEKKLEFKNNLKRKIKLLEDRIDILKIQFDFIKKNISEKDIETIFSNINLDKEDNLELKFSNITQIRKNLFQLDVDIRELMIYNLEFDTIFKELIKKWIKVKIEIQEYLNDLDRQIVIMKEKIVSDNYKFEYAENLYENNKINGIGNELAFQILQSHIQSLFSNGIEVFKKFNDEFVKLDSKLEFLIKKKEFSHIKKLIKMKTTQIKAFIEDTEKQIDNIIGKEKIFQNNNVFNLFVRPYLNKWNASKELLINKLKRFNKKHDEKLHLSQIKYYLKIMNPIKLSLLSSYTDLEIEELKRIILNYINKNKLNAKIINNSLYSQTIDDELSDSKTILFFKNIKTIGNKIYLNFKISNPSNQLFEDLQISLKNPSYLKFLKKESFPKFLHLNKLLPGNVFKFNYVLKVSKEINKNLSDPSADEIQLNIYYKDSFNVNRKITKRINLLLS
ncbi:MAG: hypothetical protein ACTSPD_02380 [Promethearchaeota archaeon]